MIPEIEIIKRYYENSCDISNDLEIDLTFCKQHKIEEVAFYQSRNEAIKSKIYFTELLYMIKFRTIKSLLEKLNDLNINYAVVKGITTAMLSYKSIGMRSSNDIDLVVDRKHINSIKSLFQEEGFIHGYVDEHGQICPYNREDIIFYLSSTHQMAPYIKKHSSPYMNAIQIDINFKILWSEAEEIIDTEQFLSHYQMCRFQECDFRTLSLEYNLIFLCLHAYKDLKSIYLLAKKDSGKIRLLLDIYGLIKLNKVDFSLISEVVKPLNIGKYVYLILYYTGELFEDNELISLAKNHSDFNETMSKKIGLKNQYYLPLPFFEFIFSPNKEQIIFDIISDEDKKSIQLNEMHL